MIMSSGRIYAYSILHSEDGLIEARIYLHTDHPVFRGHFPERAVTPGVCQLDMIGDILARELDREYILCSPPSIKFPAMLEPGKNTDLVAGITYAMDAGRLRVRAQLGDGKKTFLKFRGDYIQHV